MSAPTHRKPIAALLGVCAAIGAVALTGCGGSSSTGGTHAATQAATRVGATSSYGFTSSVSSHPAGTHATRTPKASNPDVGTEAAQTTHRSRDSRHTRGASHTDAAAGAGSGVARSTARVVKSGGHQRARLVSDINDDNTGAGPHQLNPCSLVTLPQAQTFSGIAISSRFEAPQGPTCIYRPAKATNEITLAVESGASGQLTDHLSQRQKLTVAGRTAYCGKLGRQLLVVPLAGGQMLNISAPCGVARQFAEAALGRLGA
jgi:hypothetical protein